MSRQSILALVMSVLSVCLGPSAVFANAILDQYNVAETPINGGNISVGRSLAQTFTSGYSKQLMSIELLLRERDEAVAPAPTDPLIIEIREVDDTGYPIGNLLAVKFVYEDDFHYDFIVWNHYVGWNNFDFCADNVFLEQGMQYSIVLWSDAPLWSYQTRSTNCWPENGDPTVDHTDNLVAVGTYDNGYDWYLGGDLWYDSPSTEGFIKIWGCGVGGSDIVMGDDLSFRTYVLNEEPIANTGGPYLAAVNQTITLNGSGSYDLDGDALTYLWVQADVLGSFNDETLQNPLVTGVTAGVTDLELCVSDGFEDALGSTMLIVYDPSAGFVTGGGWIDSPTDAYKPDPALTGKATFGFVSKYKKGATEPTGNTEFQFKTADLNFHSTNYEWLVVTGSNYARFKGIGTINGSGEYKFMLWAGDNDPDTFRIKIWEEDNEGSEFDVYDNGFDQAIGGGSIVIHTN
jgi:hypothetical protein